VKLLFDENLSFRLVSHLSDLFPDSSHVSSLGLANASDEQIWLHAKRNGLIIVSKDSDFHRRSFLYGAPPKVIWIAAGNSSTDQIGTLLRTNARQMEAFDAQTQASFLILGKKQVL
jgi:predicted nuclease of predicted toxin-antitoxin system